MAFFIAEREQKKGVFETEWLTRYEQVQKSVKSLLRTVSWASQFT